VSTTDTNYPRWVVDRRTRRPSFNQVTIDICKTNEVFGKSMWKNICLPANRGSEHNGKEAASHNMTKIMVKSLFILPMGGIKKLIGSYYNLLITTSSALFVQLIQTKVETLKFWIEQIL